jgi:5-methylcytosine-specific restriction endonuclease McrA
MTMPMRDVQTNFKTAKPAPKAKPRSYWSKRADRLWGELVHLRDREQCQFCGKTTGKKDAHHILPRTFKATRWLPENGVLLCPYPCHQTVAHGDPFTAVLHYERLRGDRYRELRELAYAGAKFGIQDLRDICARLEAAIKDVQQ